MTKLINIYSLSDPRTKEVRYIGQTVQDIKRRLNGHLGAARIETKKSFCRKNAWIRELVQHNLMPVINLVAVVKSADKVYWEAFYAEAFKSCNLLNSYAIRKHQPYREIKELNNLKLVKPKNS